MILVGIDDTDVIGSRGTNQLAKAMVKELADHWRCERIVRHQLLDDPRVPYTSKNGSASLWLEPTGTEGLSALADHLRVMMRREFVQGSDPGLCVVEKSKVPVSVVEFGCNCKRELVTQDDARTLATIHGIILEDLGGTGDGVIGALAAVGLATAGSDGRIVQLGQWEDDITGVQCPEEIIRRGVTIRSRHNDLVPDCQIVDVGKKLRPNLRNNRAVLFVERDATVGVSGTYRALKMT